MNAARISAGVVLVVVGLLSVHAHGDIAWDNNPEDRWIGISTPIRGAGTLPPAIRANQFTSAAAGVIDEIVLRATLSQGSFTPTLHLDLYSDDGNKPGSVLASWHDVPLPFTGGLLEIVSVQNLNLSASLVLGQKYWLVGSAPAGTGWGWAWTAGALPNFPALGLRADSQFANGPWLVSNDHQNSYRITTVPEPAASSIAAAILGMAAGLRRRFAD